MATSSQTIGVWILMLLYMAVILFFVIRGARKIKTMKDFALGSITFSPVFVALSLSASMTSAATFVINPGFIANYGWSGFLSYAVFFPLAAFISLIVLSKSFRKYGQSIKALSLSQWIGTRFANKNYGLFMAFLSLLLIVFIVLIAVALTKVLSNALHVNELYVLIGVICFVFGYIMYGGANSMIYTNTIQASIMFIVAIILLASGYQYFSDGFGAFFAKLSAINPDLANATNPHSPLFRDLYEIIFAQVVVGAAVVMQPHMITKSLLLKREEDVNKFLTVTILIKIVLFSVVFTGLYARLTFPDLSFNGKPLRNDEIIPIYVLNRFAEGGFSLTAGLIVILGLLSAGLSTLEGLIQSISTIITNDIIRPVMKNTTLTDKQMMTTNKLVIIAMAIVTFLISYKQMIKPNLSVGILAQIGVYAYFSAAFIPVLFGVFLKKAKVLAAFAASLTAIIVHFGVYYILPYFVENFGWSFGFFTKYLQGTVRNPAISASTAIILSTIVGLSIYFLQLKKDKSDLQNQ